MRQLSPDDGFPARLFCASLARLFMLFLGLIGVLSRTAVPLGSPAQTSANVGQGREGRHQRLTLSTKSGDSLESVLIRHGLRLPSAETLIHKLRPFLNVRTLPAGQKVDLLIDTKEDSVRGFELAVQRRVVRADITPEGWLVNQRELPFTSQLKVVRGTVTDNLARSLVRAGLASEQASQLQEIFASDLDVLKDAKAGDAFVVVASERVYVDGQHSAEPITAASLKIAGEYYSAFEYGDSNGQPRYFDAEGIRLPHRFLAAPLKYDRISSTFGLARPDPMTGEIRPHEAIDYVAVAGTPVVAVADGVVKFAGWYGGYGFLVEINHGDGYATSYGHLLSFGDSVKIGARVKAGDAIGRVGNTGHTTGPHLHFELSLGQTKLDYLTARIHTGETLSGAELQRFQIARDERLAAMQDGNLQISRLQKTDFY